MIFCFTLFAKKRGGKSLEKDGFVVEDSPHSEVGSYIGSTLHPVTVTTDYDILSRESLYKTSFAIDVEIDPEII